MRFELSDDQQLLRSSTRDFFTKAAPLEQSRRVMEHEPRGFEAPQWRQLAEMGYVGLVVPGELRRPGARRRRARRRRRGGRPRLPAGSVARRACSRAALLAAAGGQDELLAPGVRGHKAGHDRARTTRRSRAAAEPAARFESGRVRGTKYFVPFAAAADALCVVTPEGVALVSGPFDVTPTPTIDLAQRFATVTLDHAATVDRPRRRCSSASIASPPSAPPRCCSASCSAASR